MEGDRPAKNAPGVKFLRRESGAAIFSMGSGEYSFTAVSDIASNSTTYP
jgi:hypothetical protein